MRNITIQATDGSGTFSAYCALPAAADGAKDGKAPGIVVLQEIFGVNHFLREVCDQYAMRGYVAVCPDLFWRIEPGVELTDRTQAEWDRAFELMNAFLPKFQDGLADIQATIDHVRAMGACSGKVGAVGYCLGGSLAFATACHTDIDAASGYYPVQIENALDDARNIRKPLILHIAEKDGFCPPEAQAKIRAALEPNPLVTVYSYPGVDHAFARSGGLNYDAASARSANDRTAALFRSALG